MNNNDTYICPYCNKQILSINKIMHEIHCQNNRNNNNNIVLPTKSLVEKASSSEIKQSKNSNIKPEISVLSEQYSCPKCGMKINISEKQIIFSLMN